MSFEEILKRNPNLTLADLQELQKMYDGRFVDNKFDGFDKVRHTYAHMGKLMGRLATYVEAVEEGKQLSPKDIREKVIPDLLVYAAWLSDVFDVHMESAYLERFVSNLERLHGEEIPTQELRSLRDQINKR